MIARLLCKNAVCWPEDGGIPLGQTSQAPVSFWGPAFHFESHFAALIPDPTLGVHDAPTQFKDVNEAWVPGAVKIPVEKYDAFLDGDKKCKEVGPLD